MIAKEEKQLLKIIWDYVVMREPFPKCDLIMGCGCANLTIPVTCSQLFHKGFGDLLVFAGGLGKITKHTFSKPEAEIFSEIAIQHGISPDKILLETQSTNTGDNFRFTQKLLAEKQIKSDRILIVHSCLSERRTLSAAKAIMPEKEIYITSAPLTFEQFIKRLEQRKEQEVHTIISALVGDIQRLVIFPQFGWHIKQVVPKEVLESYERLKQNGYNTYVFSKEEIQELINENGVIKGQKPNYFC